MLTMEAITRMGSEHAKNVVAMRSQLPQVDEYHTTKRRALGHGAVGYADRLRFLHLPSRLRSRENAHLRFLALWHQKQHGFGY